MGYIALLMFVIFYIYAAMGSMMFADINPVLWQDVSISMLTLFRIATFEDWTDMVGAILEVMSEEHRNARELKADNNSLPATQGQVVELQAQIAELKTLLSKTSDITNSNK